MASDLESAILRTTAYFSYFSYPLTSFEIWKWLLDPTLPYSYKEVCEALSGEIVQDKIRRVGGFYGLGKVEEQVEDRAGRLLDALQKYASLRAYISYVSRIRAVRGIAICNSLAFHHTTQASDVDLFIVTEPGRTWTARFLTALPLMAMRRRPGEGKRHPVCLSFFASESALALEGLRIGEEDPYLAYWAVTLIPLLDRSLWQRKFFEDNRWVKEHLPNAYPVKRARAYRQERRRALLPNILSEKLLRKVQEERFPKHIKAMMNVDTRVVVRDDMLKFHDRDRREEIWLALEERMKTLV
jgi:hypothetical protein